MSDHIGNYEIVRLLARGGMATVYLVRQPALDREVVLKRLDLASDDPRVAQRFVTEARLAAALDHPNVVTLFDFFEHDGVPYIAMEYVGGGSLRSLVGRLALPQVLGVVEGMLAGLGHAERHGIAHRDLKPENVLVTLRGNVKIADFGIARAYDALTDRLTTTGMTIGTPAYMAPEQAVNEKLGPYTDLYSVGVIVYELLAGRPPFDAKTPVGLLYCHVHKPPPPLAELMPRPQPVLAEWVEWLLAKAPGDRPQSAAEAWNALEETAVAQLGPYWRRSATITSQHARPEETPSEQPTTPVPERTAAPASAEKGHRRARVLALLAASVAGVALAIALEAARDPDEPPAPTPTPVPAVAPYDFNRDGRQELVVAMLRASPRGSATKSGVVLIRRPRGARPAWEVVTESSAGLPGRASEGDDFGSGLSSADIDRDGWADLAIGTPGRDRVSVLYGGKGGIAAGRNEQFHANGASLPSGAGAYGYGVLAQDVDRDKFADLLVAAPGERPGQPGTGAVHLRFGGKDGLTDRSRVLLRPEGATAGFGTRIRAGDLDNDGHVDIVEGAPTVPTAAGHLSYCRGARRGPLRCRAIAAAGGTSGLAVADVNGDDYDDIIQGDSQHMEAFLSPGEVRVWLGSSRGPRRTPLVITQDTTGVPGASEPGDEFGAVVDAGDVDSDGYADIIVGAVREDEGAGKITVIRGGEAGHASVGNTQFDQDSDKVPGTAAPDREFGATLTVLALSADQRPDLAVAARGEDTADERIMLVEGGTGMFAPGETRITTLRRVAAQVHAPRGGRIRLARDSRP